MEWFTDRNSSSYGPNRSVPPAATSIVCGVMRCSVSLLATSPRVSRDPTIGISPPEQVRHAADVVLVRVRQHERLDLVEPVSYGREVRQDQIDARLILFGKEHAAVHDKEPSGVLKDGHVAADLAKPAERHNAQAVCWERRRRAELRVASGSGGRTDPPGRPSRLSAAFVRISPCVRNTPV